jgi:hypothetical protein
MFRRLVIAYGGLRIAYALALLALPARTARPWLGDAVEEPGATIAIRGLGARDLALAAGGIAAVVSERSSRPWLAACAASDAADLAATLIADGERLPRKSKPGTVLAAGAFGAAGAALAALER